VVVKTTKKDTRHNVLHTNSDSFTEKETNPMLLHYPRTDAPESGKQRLHPIPVQELTKEVHSEMIGYV